MVQNSVEILIEPSDYRFLNAGDAAMMQIAMKRLCSMWPNACMHVFTDHPDLLPHYSSRVSPLVNIGRRQWLSEKLRESHLFVSKSHHTNHTLIEQFLMQVGKADLFVVAGMGGFTSAFTEYAQMVLNTLALAQARKVPTVLFGQGIGPFDKKLEKHARRVLRKVDYIALREGRHGPALLRSWGIPEDKRWTITGDDAIELAIPYRREQMGRAIGINVRIAKYSGVSEAMFSEVRPVLKRIVGSLDTVFRAVPISRLPEEDDNQQIEALLRGCNALERTEVVDTPDRVMQEIQHCRIVITGSYHAGVFALAQGIPVIGLVANDYYQWKFEGLTHQFGKGCCVLQLRTSTVASTLYEMVHDLWNAAPALRPVLLAAADRQQFASRAAYDHVLSRVGQHSPAGGRCAFQS